MTGDKALALWAFSCSFAVKRTCWDNQTTLSPRAIAHEIEIVCLVAMSLEGGPKSIHAVCYSETQVMCRDEGI